MPIDQPLPEVVSVRDPSHRTSAIVLSLSNLPAASEFAAATEVNDDLLNGPITPRHIPGRQLVVAELQGNDLGPAELEGTIRARNGGEGGNSNEPKEPEPVEAP